MNITAGIYKGRRIIAPDETITRPTLSKVRMSVFNTLQSITDFEKCSFLDMYAGSGIMGIEALSRGFEKVVMIEKNKKVFNIIKTNLKNFEKESRIRLILGDSIKVCAKLSEKFDVIYIDPPYYSGIYESSLAAAAKISRGMVILEHVTAIDFSGYNLIKQKKYGDKYITIVECRDLYTKFR